MRRCPSSGQCAQRALIIACSEHRVLQVERAQAREAVAVALGVGFVAVRKPGTLFPWPTINVRAGADHRGQPPGTGFPWSTSGRNAAARHAPPGSGRSVLGQVLRALTRTIALRRSRFLQPRPEEPG
ncbi:MAG: hypothetical protein QOG20_401 [Pseudonocardiales bacterium]|jgi:hypothetical protein|nr:hypothetical protein [Pseudonocardiales bacterium]